MQFRGSAGAYASPYHVMPVAAKIGEANKEWVYKCALALCKLYSVW